MSARKLASHLNHQVNKRRNAVLAVAASSVGFLITSSAPAGNYYWDAGSSSANWSSTAGGTNWSSSADTLSDPGTTPGAGDDVFFTFSPTSPATNTIVDLNTSIKGLTFNNNAAGSVGIGGTNVLTIGADGLTVITGTAGSITLSANVAIGAAETWSNNVATGSGPNPLTVSGALSGSSALSLQGTGSTLTPSGAFNFTGANTFSGALTLVNANTSLTLSGNGTLPSVASITLGGGTTLTVDDTVNNVPNRLSGSLPVNSNGGTINLLGNSGVATTEQIGTLNLNTGGTNINVTPGGAQSATLTIGAINRLAGAGVNFSSNGTVALTNPTLSNGIIGGWATIGAQDNSGNLDFATVSAGQITAYSAYDTNVGDLTAAGTSFSTSNIKLTSGTAVMTGPATTVNTVYMSGNSGIQINAAGANTTTLTIGAGGIIANGGTGSYSIGNNQALVTNATFIGGPSFSGQGTGTTQIENQAGVIAVPSGTPDLVVTVAGSYTASSGLINGALQLNIKNITDTTTALGTRTALTANNSTTVTLTSGTTSGLYPGATVTGLAGTGITGTTQYVVNILDPTHFTIGNAPTAAGGSATATFVGHTGLTKDGGGLLDIADGNESKTGYTFQGPVTVNGGVLLVDLDTNLGIAPSTFNPAAVVLNGGELRSTAGLSFAANRGITVGPQGGTISYVGGSALTLTQKITGPGGVTFDADSYDGAVTYNISNTTTDTYQGPTILEVKNGSTMTLAVANALPSGTAVTLGLAPSFQSGIGAGTTAVTGFGALNLSASSMTIGSLASPVGLTGANVTGTTTTTLTIGGTAANPVNQSATYNGIIAGANLSIVKNGGGVQTFAGASTYGGTTTVNGGTLLVTNTTGSATGTGAVTVANSGTLGGSGIITGAVTVGNGGALSPAITPTGANTLQLKNLNLNGGSVLNLNLGAINSGANPIASPSSDNIFLTGALAVGTGTDAINLTSVGSGLAAGTYALITAASVPANFNGTTFNVSGPAQFVYQVNDDTANNSLDLVVTVNPTPPITWVGAPGSGTWNTTSAVWKPTGGSGAVTYADGSTVTFDNTPGGSGGTFTISIPANVAPGSMVFNNNTSNNYTFSGAGGITGTASLTKSNNGTVTFDNANTFTGSVAIQGGTINVGDPNNSTAGALAATAFTISSGAALNVNGAGTLGAAAITNGGTLTVAPTATVNPGTTLNNSATATFNNPAQSLAALSGAGSLVLNGTALNVTGGTTQYDGLISGPNASLTISAGASLTLTNPSNSYGLGTTVNGGTLIVNNASGSPTGAGAVAVNNGGILGGSGFIGGPVTISAAGAGHLHPSIGSSLPTTFTINNNLTLNDGSVLDFGINGVVSDLVQVNGNLTFNGAETVNVVNLGTVGGGTYEIFGFTGTLTNNATFTINPANVPAGATTSIVTPATGAPAGEVLLNIALPAIKWTGAAGTSGAGNWDTTSANWTPSPTGIFTNATPPTPVIFDNSGTFSGTPTTITIVSTGVIPGGITFNNGNDPSGPATPYTFVGGAIGGTGNLVLSKTAGFVTLAGSNTFSGGVVISGGSLLITPAPGSTAGALTGAGTGTISVNAGTLSVGSPTVAVTLANNILLGGGAVGIENGTASITLSGTITAAAGTTSTIQDFDTINGGAPGNTQDLIFTGSLAGSGNLVVDSVPGNSRDLNGVRLRDSTASTFSGTITIQPAVKFELQTNTATGSPMGTGTLILQPGIVTGTTNAGTFPIINLRNNAGASVNLANPVQVNGAGANGVVFFNLLVGAAGETFTMGPLTAGGSGGANVTIATGATASALQTLAFPSVITQGGIVGFQPGIPLNTTYVSPENISLGPISEDPASTGGPTSIVLNGTSTLTLTAANSYGGSTTVNSGKLLLGAPGAIPATSDLIVNAGGAGTGSLVDLNNGLASNDQTVNSLSGSGGTTPLGTITNSDAINLHTLIVNQSSTTTYFGVLTGNLGLTMNGTGNLTLSGTNTYTGPTIVNAGTLSASFGGTLGTGPLAVNNPNTGPGTDVVLNLSNTADTMIGSLSGTIATPSSGTNTATIVTNPGNNFIVTQTTPGTFAGVISSGGNFVLASASTSTLSLGGANTYTGTTTINGGVLSTGATGMLSMGGAPGTLGQSSNAAANLVINGGTLQYANTAPAGQTTDRLFTIGPSGATLDASGGGPITFAGNGTGSANAVAFGVAGGSASLTFIGTGTGVFAPVIGDNGGGQTSVTVNGVGKGANWTLSGSNNYTGATTVQGGSLNVAGSLGNTAVTVSTNGTLGGRGSVGLAGGSASITIQGGGTIAPSLTRSTPNGAPFTIVGTGSSLSFAGGNFTVVLQKPDINASAPTTVISPSGIGADEIIYSGTAASTGMTIAVNDTSYATNLPKVGDEFFIIDGTTGSTAFSKSLSDAATITSPATGITYSVNYNVPNDPLGTSNDVMLKVTALPEPAGPALLGIALMGLLSRRRRRTGGSSASGT
jgi:autotransporter-associated beta strand protein